MIIKRKFKEGAASFYIVAFSTLILLIVATSFAAIIISEITRTSNDDLAQSAYDSAMAGVEDAKMAYYNYQNCKASASGGSSETCNKIISLVEKPSSDLECTMVGDILNRTTEIQEYKEVNTGVSNNMQQEYTCAMIKTKTKAVESNMNSTNTMRVYNVKFASVEGGLSSAEIANNIKQVRVSWFSGQNLTDEKNVLKYANFNNNKVVFGQLASGGRAVPPTISIGMVQTANSFSLDDFEKTNGSETDRGMLYLVPTNGVKTANDNSNYRSAGDNNTIGGDAFAKSNNKQATNLPYTVNCPQNVTSDYACTALIDIPSPIGGTRNPDTFMFAVSLPYGTPNTDFALEFYCAEGVKCGTGEGKGGSEDSKQNQATLDGVQIVIDSTGRANDLYRRVEVTLEEQSGTAYLSVMGPLILLRDGGSNTNVLTKDYTVLKEWNF